MISLYNRYGMYQLLKYAPTPNHRLSGLKCTKYLDTVLWGVSTWPLLERVPLHLS